MKTTSFLVMLFASLTINAQRVSIFIGGGTNKAISTPAKSNFMANASAGISIRLSKTFDVQAIAQYSRFQQQLLDNLTCESCGFKPTEKSVTGYSTELPLLIALKAVVKPRKYSINLLAGLSINHIYYETVTYSGTDKLSTFPSSTNYSTVSGNYGVEGYYHFSNHWSAGAKAQLKLTMSSSPNSMFAATPIDRLQNIAQFDILVKRNLF